MLDEAPLETARVERNPTIVPDRLLRSRTLANLDEPRAEVRYIPGQIQDAIAQKELNESPGSLQKRNVLDRSRFEKLQALIKTCEPLPPRTHHAVAAVKQGFFVFGGEVPQRDPKADTQVLSDMWEFNFFHGIWRSIKHPEGMPWPEKRKGHTLVGRDKSDSLILFGGVTTIGQASGRRVARTRQTPSSQTTKDDEDGATGSDLIYFNDVWEYNATNSTWREIRVQGDKPTGRAYHSAAMFGDKFMFIFGGYGCHEDTDIWVLDLELSCWERMVTEPSCERPSRRFGHVSAYHQGCFYIFGGQTKTKLCDSAVWKFNAQTCRWIKIEATSQAPQPRTHAASAVIDCRWLLHGGSAVLSGPARTLGTLHEFNFRTEKWRPLSVVFPTPPSLEMHKACLAMDGDHIQSFILTGGGNLSGSPQAWPNGAYRLDFIKPLANSNLNPKLEDAYLFSQVRDVIEHLWRQIYQHRIDAQDLHRLRGAEVQWLDTRVQLERERDGLRHELNAAQMAICTLQSKLQDQEQELVHRRTKSVDFKKQLNDAAVSLEDAEVALSELRDSLKARDAMIESLGQSVQNLKSDNATLEEEIIQRKESQAILEKDLKDAQTQRDVTMKRVTFAEDEAQQLQETKQQMQKQLDLLKSEILVLKDENEALKKSSETQAQQITDRDVELAEVKNVVAELQSQIDKLQAEKEETARLHKSELDRVQAKYAEEQVQIEMQWKQKLEQEAVKAKQEVESLTKTLIEETEKHKFETEKRRKSFQLQLTKKHQEHEQQLTKKQEYHQQELTKKCQEHEAAITTQAKEHQKQLVMLSEEVQEIKEELEQTKKSKQELRSQLDSTEEALADLRQSHSELVEKHSVTTQEKSKLQQDLITHEEQHKQTSSELRRAVEQIERERNEHSSVQKELLEKTQTLDRELLTLRSTIDQLESQNSLEVERHIDQARRLEATIQAKDEHEVALKQTIENLESSIDQLNETMRELREDRDRWQNEMQDRQDECKLLHTRLQDLRMTSESNERKLKERHMEQIEEKDLEIVDLRSELDRLTVDINKLRSQIREANLRRQKRDALLHALVDALNQVQPLKEELETRLAEETTFEGNL